MALQNFDYDMDIIAKLDDEPNDVGGLSANDLKAEFDKGGNLIKRWINEVLIPHLLDIGEGHDIEDGDAKKLPTRPVLRFLNSRLSVEEGAIVIDPNGKDGDDGKSAYEAAQEAGYGGTEAEFNEDLATVGTKANISPKVEILLSADAWVEVDVGYKQQVSVEGGTVNTMVSLQLSAGQVVLLIEDYVAALMVNNDGGTFYAYAVGGKPSADMTVQATLEEVAQ